jgi:CRISPR-associated protein Cmr1
MTEGIWPENVPHLSRKASLRITYPSTNGQEAWEYLIRRLSGFRQAPVGRTKGSSNWPEPKNIRRMMGQKTILVPQHPKKFPRAAFGLPIVFHFKDGDIKDTILQGAEDGYDRLASPLILRPIVCKDGKAIGLALLLEGPRIPPGGIVLLESETKKRHKVETTLELDEAAEITPLSGQTDVLQAFLDYL